MALKICIGLSRGAYISGQTKEFIKYEKDIMSGKIPCPFTVLFKDKEGEIVHEEPMPLKPNGVSKVKTDFTNPHEIGTDKWFEN